MHTYLPANTTLLLSIWFVNSISYLHLNFSCFVDIVAEDYPIGVAHIGKRKSVVRKLVISRMKLPFLAGVTRSSRMRVVHVAAHEGRVATVAITLIVTMPYTPIPLALVITMSTTQLVWVAMVTT